MFIRKPTAIIGFATADLVYGLCGAAVIFR